VKIRSDLEKSKPLCIVLNGPQSFAGRKVGALVPDGVDATLIGALRAALEAEGAALEIIAPTVGGVQTSDGASLKADLRSCLTRSQFSMRRMLRPLFCQTLLLAIS